MHGKILCSDKASDSGIHGPGGPGKYAGLRHSMCLSQFRRRWDTAGQCRPAINKKNRSAKESSSFTVIVQGVAGRSAREMVRVFYLHLTKFTVGIKGEQVIQNPELS